MITKDLCDRVELRRLTIALVGGFHVDGPAFNKAFCRVLADNVAHRPEDIVPVAETVSRIQEIMGWFRGAQDRIAR